MAKKKVLFRIPLIKLAAILSASFIINFSLCYYYSLYYDGNFYLTLWLNFMIQPVYFSLLVSTVEFDKLEIVRYKCYADYFKKRFYVLIKLVLFYIIYLFISMILIHQVLSAEMDTALLLRYLWWNGLLFILYNCLYIYSNYIGKRLMCEIILIISFVLQMLFAMYMESLRPYFFMAYPFYIQEINNYQMGAVMIVSCLSVYWLSAVRIKEMGN